MKKLALAPAVALAITGLAASPVMAAPTADAFGQTNVQQSKTQSDEAEEQAEINAAVSVTPQEISQSDFADQNKGVQVQITGLEAGDKVSDNVTYDEGDSTSVEGDTFSYSIYFTGEAADFEPQTVEFDITVQREGEEDQVIPASFTVVEDGDAEEPEAPAVDPKVSLNTEKIAASDFEENGLEVTGEGFTPGSTVNVMGNATQSPFFQDEVKADDNGKISTTVEAPEDGLEPGDYSVSAVDAETEEVSNYAKFTVTEDETEEPKPTTPAAEAKLTVSPETIEAVDFVVENKGVTLAVENCEPGSDVHYVVTPEGNSNVTAYDNTVKADDEGKASVNVYGTSANDASAYLGDYDVSVTCGDDEMTGAFTVGDDANAGGSDGNEDGNEDGNDDGGGEDGDGGGELPRTGTELTGLVGGAALLLIGGAAVTMTMRRKKVAQDLSEI
ncbi:hypothetical protein [Brevibacterium aurantiacum]|uniref:LPXTG cell wall anchor domain-containing protein n=1 Tax=Brevibacterium aurantiacum TaxID=273384 RepID=A0A556CQL2_BREAU|nr:hypothetical protein [Brevibacterium aurantiacum]TSI19693.1 hypothetical protein FO013_01740 [Brevibacterium aurantiacum]